MTGLLARPVIPIASVDDAETTYAAVAGYLDPAAEPVLVHVIEKAGGGIDKAGVEQRKEIAVDTFAAFERLAVNDGISCEREIVYATDIADGITDAARTHDATAIVFTARGGGRIVEFLSGNVKSKLTSENEIPVVVLPSA